MKVLLFLMIFPTLTLNGQPHLQSFRPMNQPAVTTDLPLVYERATVIRKVASAGWLLAHHILLKGEYVQQAYRDFPEKDIPREAEFQGWMLQAVVGF